MSSLSQQIDRLAFITKAVSTAADETGARGALPFTTAVLETPLGDLIRDIDPSELGLFNLVKPQDPLAPTNDPHLERVEFTGATPLKRPHARRDVPTKPVEVEPETYARAALKYIDRYQSIRPMPRAFSQAESLIERLAAVRTNLSELADTLRQVESASQPSAKNMADEEQNRIDTLQSRIAELKQRKQSLAPVRRASLPKAKKPSTPPPEDQQQDEFWSTPAASARAMRFTEIQGNLLDEEVDLPDSSILSIATPIIQRTSARPSSDLLDEIEASGSDSVLDPDLQEDPISPIAADSPTAVLEEAQATPQEPSVPTSPEPKKLSNAVSPPSPSVPSPKAGPAGKSETPLRQPKVKVTSEMERIVAKIWSTVGDIIMPGHPLVTDSGKGLRAKETLFVDPALQFSAVVDDNAFRVALSFNQRQTKLYNCLLPQRRVYRHWHLHQQ
ncbi:hypothetical protein HGRIS_002227 [Hohenbuehelia grisea]|uniref:Uncharacterized protein n=1 Tax=Hohenbuehelia grisea TaxID=104357 RepID=A0ABR3JJW2_9AGAR